jgi:tape measure domain-containing protein
MATEYVGDLAVRIVPDGTGLPAGISQILSGVQKSLNQTVNLDTRQASQNVQSLGNQINNDLGGALISTGAQVAAFTGGFYAARAMINKVRGELAQLYDPLVKATAGFNAILGQQKGSKLLEDIRQFAKDSPFVTGELVNYSQQLLGVGQSADSIIPLLQNTGDLIASLGGSQQSISRVLFTLTQVRSIGRLAGQDAMQLQSAQIPITKLLAESMDIPLSQVKKLQEQGKISADKVFEALNKAGEKVRGSMDAVTNTIEGARSVLQDTITIMFQNQTSLRAIYDDVVKSIKGVAKALGSDEVTGAVTEFFDAVYEAYQPLKTFISEFAATGGKLAMVGLQTTTDILSVLAKVLNAIPEPMLKLLAQTLATLAAVRAPLMLSRYVGQIKELAGLVSSGNLSKAVNRIATGITDVGDSASVSTKKVGLFATALQSVKSRYEKFRLEQFSYLPEAAIDPKWRALKSQRDAQQAAMAQQSYFGDLAGASAYGAGAQGTTGPWAAYMAANKGKFIAGGLAAASVGSQFIPQGTAIGAGAAGALSMGSMGAMAALSMGAAAPVAIGVAAGAAIIGGITSWINKSKEMEKAMIAKWEKIGSETAQAWIKSQSAVLEGEGQAAIDTYNAKIKMLEDRLKATSGGNPQIEQWQRELGNLQAMTPEEREPYGGEAQMEKLRYQIAQSGGKATKESRVITEKQIEDTKKELKTLTDSYNVAIQEILRMDPETTAFFNNFDSSVGGMLSGLEELADTKLQDTFVIDPTKVGQLQQQLDKYGVSVQKFLTSGAAVFLETKKAFDALPDAAQRATEAVNRYNAAIDEAAAKKPFEAFQKFTSTTQSAKASAEALRASLFDVTKDTAGATLAQIQSSANTEYNEVYQRSMKNMEKSYISPEMKKAAADANALKESNLLIYRSFETVKTSLGMTDEAFTEYLKTLGQYEQYMSSKSFATNMNVSTEGLNKHKFALDGLTAGYKENQRIANGAQGSLLKIAQTYGTTVNDLSKILNLQGQINPHMRITVDANIQDAAYKLGIIRKLIGETANIAQFILGFDPTKAYVIGATNPNNPIAEYVASLRPFFEPKPQRGGGGGGVPPLEQATNLITDTFKNVANTIKQSADQWKASVKESVQYQSSVSASTAIRNAQRQTKDLQEMATGIAALRTRGLSDAAINALGLTGTQDIKQLRKLLGASDTELIQLSEAIKARDAAATDAAEKRKSEETKKNITDAIVAAAKILKIKVTDEQVQQIVNQQIDITLDASDEAMAKLAKKVADLLKGVGVTR